MRLHRQLLVLALLSRVTLVSSQAKPMQPVSGAPRNVIIEAAAVEFVRSQLDTAVIPKVLLLDPRRFQTVPRSPPKGLEQLGPGYDRTLRFDSLHSLNPLVKPGVVELEDSARVLLCRGNPVGNGCLRDGRYALLSLEFPTITGDSAAMDVLAEFDQSKIGWPLGVSTFRLRLRQRDGLWSVQEMSLSSPPPKIVRPTGPGPLASSIEGAAVEYLFWYFKEDSNHVFTLDNRNRTGPRWAGATDLMTLAKPGHVEVPSGDRTTACRQSPSEAKCFVRGRYALLTFSPATITGRTGAISLDTYGAQEPVNVPNPTPAQRGGGTTSHSTFTLERVGDQWRVVNYAWSGQ